MTDNSKYLGLKKIDKRTGEKWEVIRADFLLHVRSLKSGKLREVPYYRFEKWYVTQDEYAKMTKAR